MYLHETGKQNSVVKKIDKFWKIIGILNLMVKPKNSVHALCL